MAFPAASGQPQYSGNFIPEIWSSKLQVKFYAYTVFGSIANTDFEGEIKRFGDKVNVRTIPTIPVRNYTKGMSLQLDRPDSPKVTLNIDKGVYYNTILDDVDKTQTDMGLMDMWSNDAAQQIKLRIDANILGTIFTNVPAANQGATAGAKSAAYNLGASGAPVGLTKLNIVDFIVNVGVVLDEQNVPETDRWIVLPAWAGGLLKTSELKQAYMTGDDKSPIRSGYIGDIDRYSVYISNQLSQNTSDSSSTNPYYALAGHKSAITFASQMTEFESLRAESTFGTIIRGLQVYGVELIKPESLALPYIYKA
jgi:hypothetical protein